MRCTGAEHHRNGLSLRELHDVRFRARHLLRGKYMQGRRQRVFGHDMRSVVREPRSSSNSNGNYNAP